jgi:HlyD family secretion protein
LWVFENPPLVRALSGGGPVTEVHVDMATDAATPSGYRWSSRLGAPVKLSGGTLCLGEIVTRKRSPMSLVIPEIRAAIGVR